MSDIINRDILELGALAVIFLFAIKEFFTWLKSRKDSNSADTLSSAGNGFSAAILKELQTMNTNHLHSLEGAINAGNDRLVEAINSGNLKTIELLGEIKGRLG